MLEATKGTLILLASITTRPGNSGHKLGNTHGRDPAIFLRAPNAL